MKALELIKNELLRKAEKHGFDDDYIRDHPEYYGKEQLISAAVYALTLNDEYWPSNWGESSKISIYNKPLTDRMVIAAAFLANQLDKRYHPAKMKDEDQQGFNQYFH